MAGRVNQPFKETLEAIGEATANATAAGDTEKLAAINALREQIAGLTDIANDAERMFRDPAYDRLHGATD